MGRFITAAAFVAATLRGDMRTLRSRRWTSSALRLRPERSAAAASALRSSSGIRRRNRYVSPGKAARL